MTSPLAVTDDALKTAARVAGLDATGAELIRDGSHVMYRLPGDVVARVGKPGTASTARREVEISEWLTTSGLPVTQALPDLPQPTIVDDRPITWWRLLPDHRPANPSELGAVLRALHALPIPTVVNLPTADPFEGFGARISEAHDLGSDDRNWLAGYLTDLRNRYDRLALGRPSHVIHGDAWQGNVAVPASGTPILLDLEDVAIGHPDWDLVQLAVDHTDFARLGEHDYRDFVNAYGGYDITTTTGFRTWADIQEFRWTCFVISKSSNNPAATTEARHRIACLRGGIARPWSWHAF